MQQLIRHRTPEAMAALKVDLQGLTWEEVYATSDPDQAYDLFLSTIIKLYDKHCPLKTYIAKNDMKPNKPWITRGIANACKKKKTLYELYIKHRTKAAKQRCKIYKNKLTNIIRNSKKIYYHKLLEQHKTDVQSTWKILNDLMQNGFPNYFIHNDNEIANT